MRRLLIVVIAALPCLAVAQNIYKVQTQDGSILFTDTPPPGSKILEERSGKPTPKSSGAPAPRAGTSRPMPSGPATPGVAAGPGSSIDAAMQEVNAAEAALQVSKRRLELGREPLPGERRGLAGGGSRLTEEYQARIAGLEREVADAEARLQKAHAARNAAR